MRHRPPGLRRRLAGSRPAPGAGGISRGAGDDPPRAAAEPGSGDRPGPREASRRPLPDRRRARRGARPGGGGAGRGRLRAVAASLPPRPRPAGRRQGREGRGDGPPQRRNGGDRWRSRGGRRQGPAAAHRDRRSGGDGPPGDLDPRPRPGSRIGAATVDDEGGRHRPRPAPRLSSYSPSSSPGPAAGHRARGPAVNRRLVPGSRRRRPGFRPRRLFSGPGHGAGRPAAGGGSGLHPGDRASQPPAPRHPERQDRRREGAGRAPERKAPGAARRPAAATEDRGATGRTRGGGPDLGYLATSRGAAVDRWPVYRR